MSKKRSLLDDLCIKEHRGGTSGALDIDTEKIRDMVNDAISDVSAERKSISVKLKKKAVLAAVAAALILGITAIAASGIVSTWIGVSSSMPDYKTLPTAERVKKDIGYDAVLIDGFANGYTFADGSIVKNVLKDENGKNTEKFKSVSFRYEKDGDRVFFSQNKHNAATKQEGEIVATAGDTDIYYYSYTNKIVPPDYKMTDEDKKAEQSGELVFSYGASTIEISKVQSVTWKKDDAEYCLMQIDGKLSADGLTAMAKEIIGKNPDAAL